MRISRLTWWKSLVPKCTIDSLSRFNQVALARRISPMSSRDASGVSYAAAAILASSS